jgi:hypothetical protein
LGHPDGCIVPRVPHAECYGDASTSGGGGGWCRFFRFWFEIDWSPELKGRINLPKGHPNKVHINCLEFVVVILQFAAVITRLRTMSDAMIAELFPNGIPANLILLVWTDNTAAKKWANKLTSSSLMGQNLLGIFGSMLKSSGFGIQCEHIAGELNIIADFISRPDHYHYSFAQRAEQIHLKYPFLRTYQHFQPSPELLQLLTSSLSSEPTSVLPDLPQNLGRFVTGEFTTSCLPTL